MRRREVATVLAVYKELSRWNTEKLCQGIKERTGEDIHPGNFASYLGGSSQESVCAVRTMQRLKAIADYFRWLIRPWQVCSEQKIRDLFYDNPYYPEIQAWIQDGRPVSEDYIFDSMMQARAQLPTQSSQDQNHAAAIDLRRLPKRTSAPGQAQDFQEGEAS